MSRETLELACQIAADALSHPPVSRAAFVMNKCGADPELRRLVDERIGSLVLGGLVTLDVKPEQFTPTMAPSLEVGTVSFVSGGDLPGERIGPYLIVSLLGEGGFGAVYLAEQSEPVKRQVAVKVLKPGMDSRQIIARFEAERQALAMMDHAAIAKVFDAGTTVTGRPFFVMELVRGEPITAYCDNRQLSTDDRLRLFIEVCRAVQHAHHKGIIHRDIKPSNVMVGHEQGRPAPKVIDFGIAKAVGRNLTDKTLVTEVRQLIGTPEYMSPEQAEAAGNDLDTRTDVYSLGVLLYELLTGSTPYDGAQLRSAAYGDMQRILREVEPPRPSTRLSTIGGPDSGEESAALGSSPSARRTPAEIARLRNTSPAQLVKQVRGELDWIVMRAIEKDRSRRYDSAAALAEDVERFLKNEPVLARPPSAAYRLRKFAARHKFVAFSALVLAGATVAVVVTLAGSLLMVRAERDAAITAQTNEKDARLVAERSIALAREADQFFLGRILGSAQPDISMGQDLTILQVVDRAAAEVGSISQPQVQARVRDWIGRVYLSLGRTAEAKGQLERAVQLMDGGEEMKSDDGVRSMFALAQAIAQGGDSVMAGEMFAAVEKRWRELHGPDHAFVAWAMEQRAAVLVRLGSMNEAFELVSDSVAIYRALGSAAPPEQLTVALNLQGLILEQTGKPAQAAEVLEESLRLQQSGETPPTLEATTKVQLANALVSLGRTEEAVSLIEEALLVRERILPAGHEEIAQAKAALARTYLIAGNYARAAGEAREAVDLYRARMGPDHEYTATATSTLGAALHKAGKYPEAAGAFAEAIKAYSSRLGEDDWRTCNARVQYAACLIRQDRLADAELHLLASERALEASGQSPAVQRVAVEGLIALYTKWEKPEEVERWVAKRSQMAAPTR